VAQDLLQQLQQIRFRAVNNLETQHQKLLIDTLQNLEKEVVRLVSELPIQEGALFNTRLAIEIRPKLQKAIEDLYLTKVQTFINDYDKIAGTIVATYGKLPIHTRKQKELVDFVQAQRIAGKTNTEDFKTAVDELKQSYGSTVTGANLAVYSSQIVQDALMGFDGQFAKFRADELGLTSYVYFGSIIRDSRDFCVEHANKIFTEEEARQLWQNDWQGKSGSDPFIDRGGYNCRHHWQPVDPEWGTVKDDGTFEYTID